MVFDCSDKNVFLVPKIIKAAENEYWKTQLKKKKKKKKSWKKSDAAVKGQ